MSKNVLITGGGSAIAQQAAIIWANRGYSIFIVDKDEKKAQAVANNLKVKGAKEVWSLMADLTDTAAIKRIQEEVKNVMAGVDILLVAQGYLGEQKLAESNADETEKIIATNFTGAVLLMELVAKGMAERKQGVIVAISSVAGDRGRKSNYAYGAAKGALAIWAAGMRHRLVDQGVVVVTIKPGFVRTPMTAAMMRKGMMWAEPVKVARDIVRAVDQKRAVIYTPWFWRWIMLAIVIIPNRLFNKLSI